MKRKSKAEIRKDLEALGISPSRFRMSRSDAYDPSISVSISVYSISVHGIQIIQAMNDVVRVLSYVENALEEEIISLTYEHVDHRYLIVTKKKIS